MNIRAALQALKEAGVEFLIIGGWSAILHGSAHVTNDLDLCYSRRRENLQKLVAALAPFHPRPRGFPPELPFLWDQATLANSTILTLSTELGMLDLIAEVPGVGTYEEAIAGCVELELFGHLVLTLDLPTLIVAKKATGRPKDLLALPELESLLEATDDP